MRGEQAGDNWWNYECPHVVQKEGYFYIFIQIVINLRNPVCIASTDPMNFGIDEDSLVKRPPVAAPEIITHEGQYYIAALNPELDGIRLAKLEWKPEQ